MIKRTVHTLVACLLLLASTSCAVRLVDLNAISTRNVNLDRVDLDALEGRRVEGEASRFVILGIPIGIPKLEEAVDDALDKGEGDLLTDAAVYAKSWTAILIGQQKLTIKGTVVNTRGAKRSSTP